MNAMTKPPITFNAALDTALTPGAYMRACRQRAGVTIRACSEAIAVGPANQALAMADLRRLERNKPGDYSRLVRALRARAAFPFDLMIFAALVAETCDPSLDDVGSEI